MKNPANSPLQSLLWVMEPSRLQVVDDVLTSHFKGGRLDLAEIEAKTGTLDNSSQRKPYKIHEGVAVLTLEGAIGKRLNMFSKISGGISTEQAQDDIAEALADNQVSALVIDIDSPGGTVDGTAELADFIRASRGSKPIYTYANGTMMSGAVWIGTAADKVFGYTTTMVGSISVVMTHYDRSKADKKAGIKRSFITSGKYKRMANDAEPLNDEARAYLQEKVDAINNLFIEGVAANLGKTPEQVAEFAEGKIYTAAQGVELGILSGIKSLSDTINAARAAAHSTNGGRHMNATEIREKFPEAAAALVAEGAEASTESLNTAVSAESARLTGLYEMLHGKEAAAQFEKLAAAGITAEQAAALTDIGFAPATAASTEDAEAAAKQDILAALQKTGQDNPGHGATASGPDDFEGAVAVEMSAGDGVTRTQAMASAARKYPDLHKKYIANANTEKGA